MTVRIGVDPALTALPVDQLDGLVGQRAAMDLAAGGLVDAADGHLRGAAGPGHVGRGRRAAGVADAGRAAEGG